jgi:hypothetical protein
MDVIGFKFTNALIKLLGRSGDFSVYFIVKMSYIENITNGV